MNSSFKSDDFNRQAWCLLGLVFDAIELDQIIARIDEAVEKKHDCFFTTPNLNFCIAALEDEEFRSTVVNSNLVLLDGMPLLWVARAVGALIPSKVSGSDVFDRYWRRPVSGRDKAKVYFFGGEADVADQACKQINENSPSLLCTGSMNPGHGTVEELSDEKIIEQINLSGADFVVVSLGALKGQLWIERNRHRIDAPVISHLGAVVNFVAGSVERAPRWIQKTGFEWLWRIYQEPSLWRRYFFDGLVFLKLIVTRVAPLAIWNRVNRNRLRLATMVECEISDSEDRLDLAVTGICTCQTIDPLRDVFFDAASKGKSINLDLFGVEAVDGAFLGLCIILKKHVSASGHELILTGVSPTVRRLIRWNCAEYLL